MCIEKISGASVKISLDNDDLERLDISYETIDSSDKKTKEALMNILSRVRDETVLYAAGSKIFVEIFPLEKGLTVYFTVIDDICEKTSDKSFMSPYEFSFSSVDSLINGCDCLFKQYSHRIFRSSLYRTGKIYRLLIYPLDSNDEAFLTTLNDFGVFCGRGRRHTAYLKEHADLMLENDAVDKMATLSI